MDNRTNISDEIDVRILDYVQRNGRDGLAEIGAAVGLSVSAVNERLKRLQHDKVITGWGARVDANAIGYGVLAWAPAFYDRRFGIPPSQSGLIFGAIVAIGGLAASVGSGILSDRWMRAQRPAARFRVTLLTWIVIIPAAVIWPLAPTPTLSFIVLTAAFMAMGVGQSAIPAAIQDIVPNRMRGQAVVLYLLIGGLLGIGFGPTAIALVTDYVFHDDAALPYALVVVSVPLALIGLWASWTGLKPYARTYATLMGLPLPESVKQ